MYSQLLLLPCDDRVARPFFIIFTPIPSHLQKSATIVTNIIGFACDRIAATDWRLERSRERAALGEQNPETEADVLAEREQIKQASNAAEAAVIALTMVEQVKTFSW